MTRNPSGALAQIDVRDRETTIRWARRPVIAVYRIAGDQLGTIADDLVHSRPVVDSLANTYLTPTALSPAGRTVNEASV